MQPWYAHELHVMKIVFPVLVIWIYDYTLSVSYFWMHPLVVTVYGVVLIDIAFSIIIMFINFRDVYTPLPLW